MWFLYLYEFIYTPLHALDNGQLQLEPNQYESEQNESGNGTQSESSPDSGMPGAETVYRKLGNN